MKFEFKNTLVPAEAIEALGRTLEPYREKLNGIVSSADYSGSESLINLPDDEHLREEVSRLAQEKRGSLSAVIVVGIGGSNMGTKAIYDALGGYYDSLDLEKSPRMFFAETVDTRHMRRISSLIEQMESPEEVLVCAISKSGKTTETVANADILLATLTERFGEKALDRFVAITDKGSPLFEIAEEKGIARLPIPEVVPGRYSVLSAVGLFPLACLGYDIEALHAGARTMREKCLQTEHNPAEHSARVLAYYGEKEYRVHDTFFFDPSLASLGGWYRQLLAESIGKEENNEGEQVYTGLTPTVSIGSRDLHSIGQLALGGPRERVTTFVGRDSVEATESVPSQGTFSRSVEELPGKSSEEILSALAKSAKIAYAEAGLPFVDMQLEGLTEYELGSFLQLKMMEVMQLAFLMNVNAFDQPAVELYKRAARGILSDGAHGASDI